MANQKQRRRRAKEKRHAYDVVEIDAEGNETVLTSRELKADAPPKSSPTSQSKGQAKGQQQQRGGRGAPQPPSWRRVFKRSAIFAPIFLATVLLLAGDRQTIVGAVIHTVFLLAVFVPFSYFMDRVVWRSHEKRQARNAGK
jgi:hypothetical protein